MIENWYRHARTFILRQQQTQLKKAIGRYPDSPEYDRRVSELTDIEKELEELKYYTK